MDICFHTLISQPFFVDITVKLCVSDLVFLQLSQNFTVGWLDYSYDLKLMSLKYSSYLYTELYDYNRNILYGMGSYCGSCTSMNLVGPMPVLYRDLDVYADVPLSRLDGTPCWVLDVPNIYRQGPLPITTLWISSTNQHLLQMRLVDGSKLKIYYDMLRTPTFDPVPSQCPGGPVKLNNTFCERCCDLCICDNCAFPSLVQNPGCPPPTLDPCSNYTCTTEDGCRVGPKCPPNGCTTFTCMDGSCVADSSACKGTCKLTEDCDFCNNEVCTVDGCTVSSTPLNYCDDGMACTTDFCVNRQCSHVRKTCQTPVVDQNKCRVYNCLLGDCVPDVDPSCVISDDPNCTYAWSQWTACRGRCPMAVGTRSRTQLSQGSCTVSRNTTVNQPCLLDCGGPGPITSEPTKPFEICWEYLPDQTWAAYLGFTNPTNDYQNVLLGSLNKITVNDRVVHVDGQPTIFPPGTSPFFVSVVRPSSETSVKIAWKLRDYTISFHAHEDSTISECPPDISLLYEIQIMEPNPGYFQLKEAQALIAENIGELISKDIYFRVKLAPNNTANTNDPNRKTSNYFVFITMTGENPMYHANAFVIDVMVGNIRLADTLIGVGATPTDDNGGIHMVVNSLGISPSSIQHDLDGWQIALIVLGGVVAFVILVIVITIVKTKTTEDPIYSSV
eukprot:TRINITY_DN1127_c0_g2_i12.p1 TRINITY_DN1127_c0_g2~~TRINITY_DN1127_c0_g2_i12.p1  ORF type:complete len:670 (-),score=89.07 TRINITY_DN1127_c0_g2_i12:199-2208(-)